MWRETETLPERIEFSRRWKELGKRLEGPEVQNRFTFVEGGLTCDSEMPLHRSSSRQIWDAGCLSCSVCIYLGAWVLEAVRGEVTREPRRRLSIENETMMSVNRRRHGFLIFEGFVQGDTSRKPPTVFLARSVHARGTCATYASGRDTRASYANNARIRTLAIQFSTCFGSVSPPA